MTDKQRWTIGAVETVGEYRARMGLPKRDIHPYCDFWLKIGRQCRRPASVPLPPAPGDEARRWYCPGHARIVAGE